MADTHEFKHVNPHVYREIICSLWDLGNLSMYQAIALLFNAGFRGAGLDLKAKYRG